MHRRALITLCLASLIGTWGTWAQANGRFPRAMRLVQSPSDPDRLAVYGTYGLLVSNDAGRHWHHVCEAATGPFNGEAVMLESLSNGQLLLGTDADLKRSEEQSCNWTTVLTPTGVDLIRDVTRSSASNELYAVVNNFESDAGMHITVLRSDDEAESFIPYAEPPSAAIDRAFTLDVAPSDPDRLYISGVTPDGAGVVVRMTDQGQTTEAFELPLTSASAAPYIAAAHPSDPDTLFVRTDETILIDNSVTANDRLLVSRDGGETWTTLIQRHAKLLGFALSPDGNTILAGYGDPVLFSFTVEPADVGIYRFDLSALQSMGDADGSIGLTPGVPFQKIDDRSTTCLRWTSETLYTCFTQQQVGFEVGVAPSDDGATAASLALTPLLDLSEVRPLQCAEDSNAAQCLDDIIYGWPVACLKLDAPCDLEEDAPDAGPVASTAEKSGCNCRMATQRAASAGSEWALVAAIWGLFGCIVGRRIALGPTTGRGRFSVSRGRRVIGR